MLKFLFEYQHAWPMFITKVVITPLLFLVHLYSVSSLVCLLYQIHCHLHPGTVYVLSLLIYSSNVGTSNTLELVSTYIQGRSDLSTVSVDFDVDGVLRMKGILPRC